MAKNLGLSARLLYRANASALRVAGRGQKTPAARKAAILRACIERAHWDSYSQQSALPVRAARRVLMARLQDWDNPETDGLMRATAHAALAGVHHAQAVALLCSLSRLRRAAVAAFPTNLP